MNRSEEMDERKRLEALARYRIMDTAPESGFNDIAMLAAGICNTPMAAISLIDERRQWFKARVGIELNETPRENAFCAIAMQQNELFVVPDTREDIRFSGNPFVAGEPFIRFYAASPLITRDGYPLGTLNVMDRVPRALTQWQQHALRVLGGEALARLELRRSMVELQLAIVERDRSQEKLRLAYRELEDKVAERTADLKRVNARLQGQVRERAREASELQAIIDSVPGIFYIFDKEGNFLRWNRNFETVTGYSAEEIRQMRPIDFFVTEREKSLFHQTLRKILSDGSSEMEVRVRVKTGKRVPYYLSGVRIELAGRICISGMGMDISERLRAEEALRLNTRAIQASVNAILITDLEGNIEYANPAFESITGYTVAESIGRNCRFLQGSDTGQMGVTRIRNAIRMREEGNALLRNYRKDGGLFWNDLHIAPVGGPDSSVTHFVGVLNDISDIKRYEEQLERQANFDSLTALANRNVLKDHMRQAIAVAQRESSFVAVGFMDLDNFKFINDSLGHTIGDELLKQVAKRLLSCLRAQDTVARYGGDEFAFVLPGMESENSLADLMERILKTIEQPLTIEGNKLFISCSIGISFYSRDGMDVDTLLKNADAAMYRAKEKGRNNFQFYTPAMNIKATERLMLEAKLRQALVNGEFALYYQPKVELAGGKVVGLEALLRWRPPSGGIVLPSTFIPLAEETGLIVSIGEWVLRTACAHSRMLQDAGRSAMQISVNISARQFEPETLVGTVRHALEDSGINAGFLELELTESLVMRNPEEAIKVLGNLKQMGLRLAIDDFGTGYSSLSYLQRFPVDRLKIDQSFVCDIGDDPSDAIIARSIISLGHSLGLSVIAEGVSSAEQLNFLRENGCDEMQGYLFSIPLPIEELMIFLKEDRALRLH